MNSTSKNQTEKRRASRRPAPLPPCGGGLRPVLPVLVAHILSTLPDSLSRREELLQALAASIPPDQESGIWVRVLQFHLQEHQRLRLEWPCAADQP